jgi:hypothetical protein
MKNGVFWDVTPFGSCKNQCFGGTQRLIIRVTRLGELETLAVTGNRRTPQRNANSQRKSVVSYG